MADKEKYMIKVEGNTIIYPWEYPPCFTVGAHECEKRKRLEAQWYRNGNPCIPAHGSKRGSPIG